MAEAYLETRRLILRRFQQTDPEDLYGYLSDRETLRHEPYLPMDREQTRAELTQRIADAEMIAVDLKSENKLFGNLYPGKRNWESLELGYVFDRRYWHRGYSGKLRRLYPKGICPGHP